MHGPISIMEWISGLALFGYVAALEWGYGGAETFREAYREILGEFLRRLLRDHLFGIQ